MVIHIVNLKLLDRVRGLSRMPYRFPIPMKFPTALAAALSAAAFSPSAHAAAYSIIATNSQTVGSTATVTGSGSKSNTTTWETGVVAEYIISDEFGQQYGMRVSISNPTGTLTAGTDSLMVARTVESQGLVDPGTLSVYINPGDTTTTTGEWSLDLNFSFYDAAFENSVAVDLLLTSLDIDAGQKYYTSDAASPAISSTRTPISAVIPPSPDTPGSPPPAIHPSAMPSTRSPRRGSPSLRSM